MASGTITVKVKSDNSDFTAGMAKSAASARKTANEYNKAFKSTEDEMKKLSSSAKALGGVFATVFAGKVAQQFINSTQEMSDAFGREMASMSASVDSFFLSLNNGGIAGFLSKMAEVKAAAKDAFNQEDILGDMRLSDTVIDAKTRALAEKYKTEYKLAKASGDTEKMQAYDKKYQDLMADYWNDVQTTQAQTLKTAIANANTYLANYGLKAGSEDILTYATKTNKEDAAMKRRVDAFNAKMKEFSDAIEKAKLSVSGSYGIAGNGGSYSIDTAESRAIAAKRDQYIKNNQADAIQAYMYNQGDTARKKIFEELASYYQLEAGYQQFRGQGARLSQGVATIQARGQKATASPAYKMSEQPKSKDIEYEYDSDEMRGLLSDGVNVVRKVTIQPVLAPEDQEKVDDWLYRLENDGVIIPIETAIGEAEHAGESILPKVDTKSYDEAIQTIGALAETMNSLSGATEGSAAAMLQWAASALNAIGQVISITGVLIAVKKAESSANAQAALTGVAASVASIPVLGPVLAVAAIASLVATFMSMPKFATGGIVGGNSLTGDRMLARVNSGEMILNASQQARLFDIANGRAEAGNGEIRLRIKGPDLVGAISNYTNSNKRL